MKIYLAGPMRGVPLFNFPAFDAAAAQLRSRGHVVCSPADLDRALDGPLPPNQDVNEYSFPFSHYMKRDLPQVCASDAVAVLPGWEGSKGARLEVLVARECDIPVLHADTLLPV